YARTIIAPICPAAVLTAVGGIAPIVTTVSVTAPTSRRCGCGGRSTHAEAQAGTIVAPRTSPAPIPRGAAPVPHRAAAISKGPAAMPNGAAAIPRAAASSDARRQGVTRNKRDTEDADSSNEHEWTM